jgi:RNA polymerase sigma-70 factor (sigma-E family)
MAVERRQETAGEGDLERVGRPRRGRAAARDSVIEVYETHYAGMLGYARLLVRDASVAEDIVQEAFARLYSSWGRVRDPERAGGYVRTTVRNLAYGRARRAAVARSRRVDILDDEPSAEDRAFEADTARNVADALQALSVRQRECIVLRHYVGLTESEIALEVGCSIGSVRTHLKRAAANLAVLLEEQEEAVG